MGKSPKPLTILVTDRAILDWLEVQTLVAKGHTFLSLEEYTDVPYVLGPGCFRMNDTLRPYLDLTIKGMWELAYPRKEPK